MSYDSLSNTSTYPAFFLANPMVSNLPFSSSSELAIYPNPVCAGENSWIQCPQDGSITVIHASGKTEFQFPVQANAPTQMPSMANKTGVYWLVYRNKQGQILGREKWLRY